MQSEKMKNSRVLLFGLLLLHPCLNCFPNIGVDAFPDLFSRLFDYILLAFWNDKIYSVVCFFVPFVFAGRTCSTAHLKHQLSF